MIVGAVHGDVLVLVLVERGHERFEVLLAADLAQVLGREVRVHPGPVPVVLDAERLRMEVHVHAVALAEAQEQVAGDPHLVCGPLRALSEDLELPLALRYLGVDAFEVDPGLEAQVDVRIDDLACDVPDVLEADARVVLALRRWEPLAREAQRGAVPVEEVLLFEAEPRAGIVRDRGAAVRWMRRPVGQKHLAHHEHAAAPGGIGEESDRLQHAVRASAFGLLCRTAVEVPDGQLLEGRFAGELHDLRLAAEIRDGLVAVQPDVFELVLGHSRSSCYRLSGTKKGPHHSREW